MQELEERIDALEKQIAEKKKELSELKRQRMGTPIKDYVLKDPDGNEVRLSELFGDHKELILIQNMGKACSDCTMWADGFNGIYGYVQRKAGFVLVSPDSPEDQQVLQSERGWRFPMASAKGTEFKRETGFQDEKGGQHPGVSVFKKGSGGEILYTNRADFDPGDDFCSVWHFYDMLSSE